MSVKITAARYNTLQQRISAIMGVSSSGAPTTGYGQTVNSDVHFPIAGDFLSNANLTDKIDDQEYRDLYIDIVRARVHQIGAAAFTVDPFVVGNYTANPLTADKIRESYISNLESLMTTIETNKFTIHIPTQASLENLLTTGAVPVVSTRSTAWNGSIFHIFTVTFATALARRHFFNAGGQIRLSAGITYAGAESKTLLWQSALSSMGIISFAANSTFSNAGVGTGSAIGNYQLTSTYQSLYTRSVGGIYTNAFYRIDALSNSTTTIQFRAGFNDLTVENVDENVQGTLSSNIGIARPDGSVNINGTVYDTVDLVAPTGTTTTNL